MGHTALQFSCRQLLVTAVSMLILWGCSSASPSSPLDTREDFSHWVADNGHTRFNFILTWYVPPDVLFGSERNAILASSGLQSTGRYRPYLYLSSEQKLRLEDFAVVRLDAGLDDRDLCPDGYLITRTRWQDQSVILSGRCE